MEDGQKEILYSNIEIKKRVGELADKISADYADKEIIIIGILKGAFIFVADLIRAMSIPCSVDFVRCASYGTGSESSEKVVMTKDIETSIKGQDVLIVEDIVDTGLTLKYLVHWLEERNPRSLKVCTLLDKRKRRKVEFEADYVGFSVADGFLVGYGLDYSERYRFLPDIYVIKE
ncbi:MAG TPA: hypoxanthine phosphoribosyltransferase [Deltaproteobacteria bacterium]|nr:hypoxanthine phosphoribosyltransferase [Deltaproteobacteria bacterium]